MLPMVRLHCLLQLMTANRDVTLCSMHQYYFLKFYRILINERVTLITFWEIWQEFCCIVDSFIKTDEIRGPASRRIEWAVFGDEWRGADESDYNAQQLELADEGKAEPTAARQRHPLLSTSNITIVCTIYLKGPYIMHQGTSASPKQLTSTMTMTMTMMISSNQRLPKKAIGNAFKEILKSLQINVAFGSE